MSNGLKETTAYYKDAIDGLRRYIATETDEENCETAAGKISEYRLRIVDANFDDIVQRTKRLRTLMHDLQAVIDNATSGVTVSAAIGSLRNIVSQASGAVTLPPSASGTSPGG